ncbi:uncharacterized protein LOC112520830 [Cynara cardunculus var. scolymus]|uniref:AB hydrolase-1 domain-containing protein n=1 Tax=Cynara cardunculus var. scolymus TaxID=59895 RepID=A0A103XGJ6_CYNCS|nr:uncharacterized protein LOC112520830 [Cynara cardunculus var. scolymus]KVH90346.1 hypothetical protein Ccrd_007641 [Cynara cardunculus var. scolymus]
MAEGKISAAAARSHTRKSKSNSNSFAGILKKLLVVFFAGFAAWAIRPPPPTKLGSSDITTPRIKLRDGRHLSYVEAGVPKDKAKFKVIFVHGFDCNKYFNPFAVAASPALVEELGVYHVSIDRPGYGESDPHPNRTVKSLALDIEEFADHLNLGPRFYVAGYSMGGQVMWSVLKYIPHRLAGAILIAPAINYWWPNLPSDLTNEAFSRQLPQDRWAMRVAHHLPWLTYWWNTRKWLPPFSAIVGNPVIYSPSDVEVFTKLYAATAEDPNKAQKMRSGPRQQGEFESLHRDLNIGSGKWEFDPLDVENPFPNNDGSVHLWMGDDDRIVPVSLERYFAQKLEWIKYHEVAGAGHMMAFQGEVVDAILKASFNLKN